MSCCSGGALCILTALCHNSRPPPTPPSPLCTVGTTSALSGTPPPCHLAEPESPLDPAPPRLNPKHPSSHGPRALLTPGTSTPFQLRPWTAASQPRGFLKGPQMNSQKVCFLYYIMSPGVICPCKSDTMTAYLFFVKINVGFWYSFFSIHGRDVTEYFFTLLREKKKSKTVCFLCE